MRLLIRDGIEEYLLAKQNSITRDTYAWYRRFLSLFNAWTDQNRIRELGEVRASHVQQFVSDAPTENTHTRHARAQIVKGFLSWCARDVETGVKRSVVDRIEMPRLVQSEVELLNEVDFRRLINACDHTMHPHRNRAILHLLLDTGIRAGELCFDSERPGDETGLRMENVFLAHGNDSYIRVMGKGRKQRTVGLGTVTTLMVRRYIGRERLGINTGFLLLGRDGEALSVRMLQQLLAHLGELAGVPDVHPHRFRHTFAVNQLLAGTSDLVLMRLMGHTSLAATQVYSRAMTQVQARSSAISVVDSMRKGVRK